MFRSMHLAALILCLGSTIWADDPKPQWQRLLKGEDANKAEDLAAKSERAAAADKYDEAIKLCEELLALRTRIQGADHWETIDEKWTLDEARILSALPVEQRAAWKVSHANSDKADRLEERGRPADAQPLREDRRKWCEKVFGDKHPRTASAYESLARNLKTQGKLDEAVPLYRKSLEINLDRLGEGHPDTGSTHNNLANALKAKGDMRGALPHARKALEIASSVHGERHEYTAVAYNVLGNTLAELGQYAEAQKALQQGLDLRRELFGEKHHSVASSYNNLAYTFADQGKHADAHPLFRKALEIELVLYGERHVETAQSYDALADNLLELDRPGEALPLYRKALDLFRELRGERHPETAKSYNNVARALAAQHKYVDAEALYLKALELYRERPGEKHPDIAKTYHNLGICLSNAHRHEDAEKAFRKALEIRKDLLGDRHPYTLGTVGNLAVNLGLQGKHADAEPMFLAILERERERFGDRHPKTAASQHNLAVCLSAQGKFAEGQPLFEAALEVRRTALGERDPETVLGAVNQAYGLFGQGKYAEARPLLDRAAGGYDALRLQIADRGMDRADFGADRSPYKLLAAAHARLGDRTAAWVAAEANLARGLADDLAGRDPTSAPQAERDEEATLTTALDHLQHRILPLVTKAELKHDQQAELDRLRAERRRIEDRLTEISVTRSRRSLAPLNEVCAALSPDAALVLWVDVSGGNGRIQERWGCVVRRTGDPHWEPLPATGPDGTWTKEDIAGPGNLRLVLTTPAAPPELLPLTVGRLHAQRIAPLEKHLTGIRRLYVVPAGMMSRVPVEVLTDKYTVSYVPSGSYLARLSKQPRPNGPATLLAVGDPVFQAAGRPAKAPTDLPPGGLLITQIVPGGAAANARLQPGDVLLKYAGAELKAADDLAKLIAEHAKDKSIAVAVWRSGQKEPAVRDLAPGKLGVVLAKEPAPEAIANRRKTDALIASAVRGKDWGDLPGTRVEVTRLARVFGDAATTFTDSAASEQTLDELRLAGRLKQFRYLHLATHGESDSTRAFEAALILSQDRLTEPATVKPGAVVIDGRLTAAEVLEHWKLEAELVTLSACESGLGRHAGGDGILGFAQAFLLAGSRSVCLSLWKVDDAATALLMDRFYQNLLGKRAGLVKPMPKAEALAEAKKWLRELTGEEALKLAADLSQGVARGDRGKEKALPLLPAVPDATTTSDPKGFRPYAHPRYWAAFILIGDPS